MKPWMVYILILLGTMGLLPILIKLALLIEDEPRWVGNIVYLQTDENDRKQIYSDKIEIGLRPDGVIVWRDLQDAPTPQEDETQEET